MKKMILTILLTTLIPGVVAAEKRMMMNSNPETSSFAGKHVMTNSNPSPAKKPQHVMTNSNPNISSLSHSANASASTNQDPVDLQNLGKDFGNR